VYVPDERTLRKALDLGRGQSAAAIEGGLFPLSEGRRVGALNVRDGTVTAGTLTPEAIRISTR
jgi:hypothetical protein